MKMDFRMTGAAELKKRLEAIGPELATKAGATAVRNSATIIKDEVVEYVPKRSGSSERTYNTKAGTQTVDYGHAYENVKVRKGKARKAFHIVYLITMGSAFWARFLEYGTKNMPAQPFMGPAVNSASDKAIANLQIALGKAIDRIVKRLGGK